MTQSTTAARQLAALALLMIDNNLDAAEVLGRLLMAEAEQRKRVQGFGIEIRINRVTGKAELRSR